MKILFIGKYYYYENTAIMLLCGYLKKHGYNCFYLDLRFERDVLKEVQKISPEIICYSLIADTELTFLEINRVLKENLIFLSVFGGPFCTVFPDLINEEYVDAVCIGEGEEALLELVSSYEKKQSINEIRSFWIKNSSGEIFKNDVRKLNSNIDEISISDRLIFDKYRVFKKSKRRNLITTRGCPFNCSFCYNNSLKKIVGITKNGYRQRSVDNVLAELIEIKNKYSPKKIKLVDDTSFINKKWTLEFLERYQAEIGVKFIACVRIDLLNEETILAMKKAGCIAVEFGIECGDEQMRNELLNRKISNDLIIENSLLLRKYNIKTMSLNMFGLPNETISQAIETIKINIKSKISFAHCVIYTPLPKTELGDYAMKNKLIDTDIGKINYKFMYANSVLKNNVSEEIKRIQYLASIIVAFPVLLNVVPLLIKFPFTNFYKTFFFIHRVFNHFFITKQILLRDILVLNKNRKVKNKKEAFYK